MFNRHYNSLCRVLFLNLILPLTLTSIHCVKNVNAQSFHSLESSSMFLQKDNKLVEEPTLSRQFEKIINTVLQSTYTNTFLSTIDFDNVHIYFAYYNTTHNETHNKFGTDRGIFMFDNSSHKIIISLDQDNTTFESFVHHMVYRCFNNKFYPHGDFNWTNLNISKSINEVNDRGLIYELLFTQSMPNIINNNNNNETFQKAHYVQSTIHKHINDFDIIMRKQHRSCVKSNQMHGYVCDKLYLINAIDRETAQTYFTMGLLTAMCLVITSACFAIKES